MGHCEWFLSEFLSSLFPLTNSVHGPGFRQPLRPGYHSVMLVGRSLLVARILILALTLAWQGNGVCASRQPRLGTTGPVPVILISVDTLRADHLSCYGYTGLRTPHIDSLTQGGTLFAEISSQAPITLPSHVSLFTSTYRLCQRDPGERRGTAFRSGDPRHRSRRPRPRDGGFHRRIFPRAPLRASVRISNLRQPFRRASAQRCARPEAARRPGVEWRGALD